MMRRIFASTTTAACAALLLISCNVAAVAQLLDPGWQMLYAGQPNYGGGLIDSVFGDSAGMPVVARAYQPAPMYSQPAPQPRLYQAAPAYYQQVPAPMDYRQVPLQQTRAYQPAPLYYRQAPVQQTQAYQPAPLYYQQPPAQQVRAYQPAPVYYQQVPPPAQQTRTVAQVPSYYRQVPPQPTGAYQAAPLYTSAVPQQVAPQGQAQPAAAPRPRGLFLSAAAPQQAAPQVAPPAPATQAHGFFQLGPTPPTAAAPAPQPAPAPLQSFFRLMFPQQPVAYNQPTPGYAPSQNGDMANPQVDPKYDRQIVDYRTDQPPGTVLVDTSHYFLYLVMEDGKAVRYGIGVGREGFTWSGVNTISAKREWPEWRPPNEMLERRPDLPRYMAGGEDNPLGARALYLGSTLYRIHGSNEPWTIGTNVSSGCIRLRNADIVDLYERVKVGTKVVVL